MIKLLVTIFFGSVQLIFTFVAGCSKSSDINFLFLETLSVCVVNFLFFVMLGVQIINNGVTILKFCDNFIFQYFPEKNYLILNFFKISSFFKKKLNVNIKLDFFKLSFCCSGLSPNVS